MSADYFNKQKEILLESLSSKYLPRYLDSFHIESDFLDEKRRLENFKEEKEELLSCYYPKGIFVKSRNGMVKLKSIEILVLGALSKGYSAKEIANILDHTQKNIEFHKDALKKKTGFMAKSDLVKLYNDQIKFLVE